ncbi:hypothetical protein D9619_004729 [Psilocybe cf. subviscida]|uniref:Uncharacterized protein n=1 Tax=Psilocybe cf. subviscida TaxID=2480587 RepID=A0A8H5F8J5_9AGAR|nr:hypothetical protein D9619_004729 [Psilocybe cf. subviscida]
MSPIISKPALIDHAQSTPHRAWETGYQSPFARALQQPLNPPHSDAQSGNFLYNAVTSSEPSPTMGAHIQHAVPPTPPSNFPLALDTSQHPERTIPSQHTASYRPRPRKVITNEITLDDIDVSAMVTLGLSPFMVGQDTIANQNRFVRNECVFARCFLRLQRATSSADARHSQTERDIYNHLERHKSLLDSLTSGPGPTTATASASPSTGIHFARADPDFLALEHAHQETCARLEALWDQVAEQAQLTQRALTDLVERLDQISIRTSTAHVTDTEVITSSPSSLNAPTPFSPHPLSTSTVCPKRKRGSSADSIIESPNTMPPPTLDFRSHHWSIRQ